MIIAILGITRKELGLTFSGESRRTHKALFGDIYIKGLDFNVSIIILTCFFSVSSFLRCLLFDTVLAPLG